MNHMHPATAYRNIVALSVAAGAACGVSRDAAYFQLLEQFSKAQSRGAVADGGLTPAWQFEVPLARSSVTAKVGGRQGMDVIRVQYSDKAAPRTLYDYVDYSNPIDVRVDRTVLYVYWVEALFGSTSYMLAYDLENRSMLAKRQVDPKEIPQK